ncbi:MAG: cytochrome c family protein [Magnetococcales bacterium]|nr:cytochrome c family protein [Magnetococcales bacterium]
MRRHSALWAAWAAALGLLFAQTASANTDHPPLQQISAAECGACHQAIFQEWQQSMHANSTALKDPIHGAMYRMMVGDPTQEGVTDKVSGKYPICLQCHAPMAAKEGSTKLDAKPTYAEGVTCVSCHTMSHYNGLKAADGSQQVGAKAYTFSNDALQSGNGAWNGQQPALVPGAGHGNPSVNPFPHAANPLLFKRSSQCLGCHEKLINANGVATCAIGETALGEGTTPTCQSCHMPVVNGHTSHALPGGHDPAMVRRAVILTLSAQSGDKGIQSKVTLQNKLAHDFPTGAPFRNLVLKITAMDAASQIIWQNFKENPLTEDPQAVLMLKVTDSEGKPVMPMLASKVAADTRLQAGESRTLDYLIPVQGVVAVRAELYYNLVNKGMIEKIGDQLPEPLKRPLLVSRAEARLP